MNPFSLAYREQQQLFLFEQSYVCGLLFQIGGLSCLTARFIVQFFVNPTIALAITMSLSVFMLLLLWAGLRGEGRNWHILPFCFIPIIFEFSALSDNALHYDAFIALIFAVACIPIFAKRRNILLGTAYSIALYLIAGSAAMVFAVSAFIICIFNDKRPKSLLSAAIPGSVLACAWVASAAGAIPSFAIGLSPRLFYNPVDEMNPGHWVPWLLIPLIILMVESLRKFRKATVAIAGTTLAIASVFSAMRLETRLSEKENAIMHECEYFSEKRRWNDVLRVSSRYSNHEYFGNYMNMALAQEGTLTEDLLKHWQNNPNSIIFNPGNKSSDARLARVEYTMGNMAAAQVIAFNSLQSNCGYNPAMLKMLTKIELMRGSWNVAEKYLDILGESLQYRSWAEHYRKFLCNDQAIMQDPELFNGRADFPTADGFADYISPLGELLRVIESNPNDSRAVSYAISFLILGKDIDGLNIFVDRFASAPVLNPLPRLVQEALVFYSAYHSRIGEEPEAPTNGLMIPDSDWCLSKGISIDVIRRFEEFQTAAFKNNGHIPAEYRDSFWFYFARQEK